MKSSSKLGVVAVRILANGAEDLSKAVKAQKGFMSMPLSAYLRNGLAYKRPAERPMIEAYESQAPEELRYFDDLGYWMGRMLPVSTDSNDSLVAYGPLKAWSQPATPGLGSKRDRGRRDRSLTA